MHVRTEISLNGRDWKLLESLPNDWRWRKIWEQELDVSAWVPATVPGVVQSDLLEAGVIPDWRLDLNSKACEWTSARDWIYVKDFTPPAELRGRKVRLRFEGVDYSAHFYLNGNPLGDHEGMFVPVEFDVSDLLECGEQNRLMVAIGKAPDEQSQIGWTTKVRTWKARFAYSWDWCTRLVPLGLWDDVKLIATGVPRLENVWVRTELSHDLATAQVFVELRTFSDTASSAIAEVSLLREGKVVAQARQPFTTGAGKTITVGPIALANPALWYANGYGEQPLYVAQVTLRDDLGTATDELSHSFGIREVTAVPNEGAPEDALEYTLVVNGKKVFIKGWNWAPHDQLYGREAPERYERLLTLARDAHCNLLRVWGGGLLEKEVFYDLCDRLGIMVWQEFMQSSSGIDNEPSSDPQYLDMIRRQARAIVPRRRNHPSLVIWCGGNELMYSDWRPIGNEHPAIAVLKEVVSELDPQRLFLPTSASGPVENADPKHRGQMHDVHGPHVYLGPREHYRFYNNIDPMLHSEFACEGAANLEALRQFVSADKLWPPDATNPVWVHHGSWWINREKVEAVFGKMEDIETFVKASQFLQAEGLRYCVESNRRRKWRCSGTLPWQFNETWPNASCTNSVDYYGQPKLAYYALQKAHEPLHVSAKYDSLFWSPGEEFRAEVWVNNSLAARDDLRLLIQVQDLSDASRVLLAEERRLSIAGACALKVSEVELRIDAGCPRSFVLRLRLSSDEGQRSLSENAYAFFVGSELISTDLLGALESLFRGR